MEILTIVPSYKPAYVYGGPVRSIAALCESFVEAGHNVTVYTTMANGDHELNVDAGKEYLVDGVRVIYFRRVTKGNSNFSPQLLKELFVNIGNYDIVHVHSWWNLITIPALWICLQKGVTPLFSPRGTLTQYSFAHSRSIARKLFHFLLGKNLLNRATLIFTSEREKKEALRYVTGKSVRVLANLLDIPNETQYKHLDKPYLKLLFLGRIDPAKNLEFLIKVLFDVKDMPYELSIAGEGNNLYVQQLQQLTSNYKQIKWIGGVEGEEKYRRLADADLLVLPSHTENFGNVIFEALSQGTPVLVSDQVGAKDYILEMKLGWVVPLDENMWRNSLTMIWENTELRKDIRTRAPLCIVRDFNRKKQISAYVELYQTHIKENTKV